MTEKNNLGYRIQDSRIKKKLTQEELAEYVGITQGHLSKIENGKEKPSRDLVIKICEVLDITSDYVFYGTVESNNPRVDAYVLWLKRQDRETQEVILDFNDSLKKLIERK